MGNQMRPNKQKTAPAPEAEADIGQKVREMLGGSNATSSSDGPSPCFVLRNMFDPKTETDPYWSEEIRSDVIGECSQLGGVVHIHIDKEDPNACVYSLQGRWFSGKMIKASYMQPSDYSKKFEGSEYLRDKLERWNLTHILIICFCHSIRIRFGTF